MFVYNIGQRKIIIKNTLKGGKSFIYDIPKTDKFISFAEYNSFEDIGFYPDKLRIELCSNIVFLTQNRKTDEIQLNVMLIDPYYEICQVALFKSSKRINLPKARKYQDVMIQNFLYCSKNQANVEFRCLT